MSIGYILNWFPQLSETFVENEIRVVREQGRPVRVFSLYPPPPELAAPTTVPVRDISYRPGPARVLLHLLRWTARRPAVVLREAVTALRLRSLTQLRGVVVSGWIASGLRDMGARHVHAHFAHDSAAAGMVAARLTGLPFTITIHAHELYLRTNGVCVRCRAADRVVTVCRYNIDQLRRLCPSLDPSRIELVYCGVDVESFPFVARAGSEGPARIVSVGRLVEIKGFDLLIQAVGLLNAGGIDVTCDIIGRGPLLAELEALRDGLGLSGVVSFPGPLPPEEIAHRLAGCDVFVLACRIDARGNRDSMPVVIKEAMAVGVPVVATREVAVPEMVDEEVGRLVDPEDPAALARGIREVLALPPRERTAMGRRGRERVTERFNLVTETRKLLEVFDSVARHA